jgi:hypothetical protein
MIIWDATKRVGAITNATNRRNTRNLYARRTKMDEDFLGSFFNYNIDFGQPKKKPWYPRATAVEEKKPSKPFLTAQDLRWLRDTGIGIGIKLQESEDA